MSDYGDEHYQSGEREVEYRDEDDERGYERYESPPRSPARSSSNSSKSSSSSSSGAGGESRHGDHSEEEERYSDENYRSQQESNNFGNAAAMGIVTGMMGNLMGSRNGASNREAGGNYYPASSGQYRNGYNGYQNGYQQLVYRQNGYGQESYGQQQQGYGENEYCDGGYGGNYPHPGPPPQQYEPTNAGYAPPPAPYSGQQQHYGGYRANESDDGRPHPQHFGPEFRDSQTGEVAQAFFEYSRCNGRRKALLIGINYIGSSAQLAGCINDVHNVQKFITERYGYQLDDIVMLTDDINDARTMPTRDNIIKAMKWLVGGAQRDDALFFHYSGHGTQTEDTDGDEQDGQDEGEFSSRFYHELLVRPLPSGCRLTAIFDSCHSATVMDLPYVYATDGTVKEPDLLAEASEGLLGTGMDILRGDTGGIMSSLFGAAKSAWAANKAEEKTKKTKTSPADVVMWSGCKDNQTSADTQEDGEATGAMSYAFISALNKRPNQSYQELLIAIRDEMRGKYTQKPQLSACHPIDTSLQFVA
ncbi:metacaspase [Cryptococcus neoformans C23]|uniref:Metacaspase n=1 Tax=Cryptococcus neoformans (strain H99 / ATCC 208821 / CBS 10515 / FGSC 9487) TaxID=235443 RepID=J9VF97_CRYN9|nr:metacaspase [Cryptococcus neoformans var. grubii H99]AUB22497.1 metacaspase [Cryptococcus neoformans var. grubii]OWZ35626.1 metacaspase [Cryptococcus neoformans var. grubii AD2-60a]OWZ47544.1 metacaspase [Cryptococcus neoformans var. grubii C23]OXC86789.1 metacaspase [Cryptococcus neoformans var. grubii AD1-7a]AFR93012.2 metacaspase [Cryptococcus neoformans var. grubii H99]|eukprot:XP_012047105.1 metacaspase [Cryptococcus neoformans var. grubii H99]